MAPSDGNATSRNIRPSPFDGGDTLPGKSDWAKPAPTAAWRRRVRCTAKEMPRPKGRGRLGSQGLFLSEGLQVLDEVAHLAGREIELQRRLVVIDDVGEGGEAAIVIETARRMRPQPFERRGAVALIGGTIGLVVVDADLGAGMHVPARL